MSNAEAKGQERSNLWGLRASDIHVCSNVPKEKAFLCPWLVVKWLTLKIWRPSPFILVYFNSFIIFITFSHLDKDLEGKPAFFLERDMLLWFSVSRTTELTRHKLGLFRVWLYTRQNCDILFHCSLALKPCHFVLKVHFIFIGIRFIDLLWMIDTAVRFSIF